jgi:hypothetical protein
MEHFIEDRHFFLNYKEVGYLYGLTAWVQSFAGWTSSTLSLTLWQYKIFLIQQWNFDDAIFHPWPLVFSVVFLLRLFQIKSEPLLRDGRNSEKFSLQEYLCHLESPILHQKLKRKKTSILYHIENSNNNYRYNNWLDCVVIFFWNLRVVYKPKRGFSSKPIY